MNNANRIAANTIAQYVRTIINVLLSIVATRWILQNLGESDYGIYTLVAGVVSLVTFLSNGLAVSTQRFLSVTQGKGNSFENRKVFNNSLFLNWSVTLFLFAIIEICSVFLFDGYLNIPSSKLFEAKTVYQLVALSVGITFLYSPYRAAIVAHENIVYVSAVEIVDSIIKLSIAYVLFFIPDFRLIWYSGLLVLVQILNCTAFVAYCSKKYEECKIKISLFHKRTFNSMLSFTGWNIYNILCIAGRMQGIAIIINKFFGTVVNAAYGLSFQVSSAILSFTQAFSNAINPQLMKAEGGNNRSRMIKLAEFQSKYSFLLFAALAIPTILEIDTLLGIWLTEIPEYTAKFCIMVIIANLADLLTVGLGPAIQAIGRIKYYVLVLYTLKLLTLPLCYVALKLGYSINSICIIYVGVELVSSLGRLPFAKKIASISYKTFVYNVFRKELAPFLLTLLVGILIDFVVHSSLCVIYNFAACMICMVVFTYLFGTDTQEKVLIKNLIKSIKEKIL